MPADGRAHRAVAGHQRVGAVLAEQARAQHDQVGLDPAQRLVVESPRLHRLGGERLGHHVRPADQVEDHLPRLGTVGVERDAELAGVDAPERQRGLPPRLAVVVRSQQSHGVDAAGVLDPHDRGPVLGEHAGRAGPGHHPHHVEHLQAGQRGGRPPGRAPAVAAASGPPASASRRRAPPAHAARPGPRRCAGRRSGAAAAGASLLRCAAHEMAGHPQAPPVGRVRLPPEAAGGQLGAVQHVLERGDGNEQQPAVERGGQEVRLRAGGQERGDRVGQPLEVRVGQVTGPNGPEMGGPFRGRQVLVDGALLSSCRR